jgi:prephenate dehydrogenase
LTTTESIESWSQVSVVGLGLIGGSMARALRQVLPSLRLVGVDREAALESARGLGLADRYVSDLDTAGVAEAFAASDLVFLATPVSSIRRWLGVALAHGALVTDCGSTKREILLAARASAGAGRFVPGHPMAGAGAARAAPAADLFEGRPWVLCPEGVEPAALASVEQLIRRIGAEPVRMSAGEHDRAVALTSHAPRVIASALTALVHRERAYDAAGPAFERLAQGAGGSAEMWRDVLGSNADEVARALRLVLRELEACADELAGGASLERNLETLAAADRARAAFKLSGRADKKK